MLTDQAGHPLKDLTPADNEEQSTFVYEIVQAMLEQAINSKLVNWQPNIQCSPTTMSLRHLPCMVIKFSRNNDCTRPLRVLQPLLTIRHQPPPPSTPKTQS